MQKVKNQKAEKIVGFFSEAHRAQHIEIKLFYNKFFVWAFLNSEKDVLFIDFYV